MIRFKKLLTWLLPFAILVLIFLIFSAKQLANLDHPPTKGWSRSISLPMTHMSDTSHLYTTSSGKNTAIYGETSKGIVKLTVNPALKKVAEKTITVHPDQEPFWASNDTLVYIKSGKLTLYKNAKASTLDPNVSLLLPMKNEVVYASGNDLKTYNPVNGQMHTIAHFKFPINELDKSANNNDIIAVTNQSKIYEVYYFRNQNNSFKKYFVHRFNDTSSYNSFLFSVKENTLHLIYSKTSYANGTTTNYFVNDVPIHSLTGKNVQLPENMINIYTADQHNPIQTLNDFNYYDQNGKDILSFTTKGTLSYKNDGQLVYTAELNGTTALAVPHSTNELSISPEFVKPGLMIWLGFNPNQTYQLYAATTNPTAISSSLSITKQDIGNAISSGLILMSINFLVVFFAFVYILPAFVYYLICYFIKASAVDNGSKWVWWGAYIVYFICLIFFFVNFLVPKLIPSELPGYLKFPGSAYTILIIFSLISWGITRFVKTEFWERLPIFTYYVVINTLFVTMFLGAYTFPTT